MPERLRRELRDVTGSVWTPFRALAVSFASVWLASRWLSEDHVTPLVVAGLIIFLAYLCDLLGRACLPDSPRIALMFLELWIFAPLTIAAIAAAAAVIVGVYLTLPADATPERKETVTALTTALTTFLTTGFISWTADKDDSRLAKRIQRTFFAKYQRFETNKPRLDGVKYFRAGSKGERLVHSNEFAGIEGWGHDARVSRARELAVEIATGDSDAT